MKPLTIEWIEKAEEDWTVMWKAFRARKNPAYNAACFHAQQCAEKYLKSRLEEAGIGFHRTHDLLHLLTQTLPIAPTWTRMPYSPPPHSYKLWVARMRDRLILFFTPAAQDNWYPASHQKYTNSITSLIFR